MKNFKICITFLIIGLIIFSFGGCNGESKTSGDMPKGEESIKVVDCAGREVEIGSNVEKIVDLTTVDGVRTLIELEAEEFIVGISNKSHQMFNSKGASGKNYIIVSQAAPELKDISIVGDIKEPNIEMIMSLKPDVIFIDSFAKKSAEDIQSQTNIPVVCVGSYGSFNYEMFTMLGKIVGKEERANELVEFTKNKVELVTNITNKIPEDKRKSLFYWSHPFAGNAPKTNGNYEAFQLAGGKNVAREGDVIPKGVYEVTKEQIVAWDPEFIFLHSPFKEAFEGWRSVDDVKEDEVIKGTKAVAKGNVYALKGELGGWDIATEVTEVFYIAKILYPEEFQNLDVEKEGDEILKRFYGIDGLYTDMSEKIKLYQWK
jgi:iron complex transport system substrate-binding protein